MKVQTQAQSTAPLAGNRNYQRIHAAQEAKRQAQQQARASMEPEPLDEMEDEMMQSLSFMQLGKAVAKRSLANILEDASSKQTEFSRKSQKVLKRFQNVMSKL